MAERTLAENVAQAMADFKGIKSAIQNAGVEVPQGTTTAEYQYLVSEVENTARSTGQEEGYADGYRSGYVEGEEEGKQAQYDEFWDVYQNNGNRKSYNNAFAGEGWNNITLKPKYDINITEGYMMFRHCAYNGDMVEWLKENNIVFDDSKTSNVSYMYFGSKFTRIGTITMPQHNNTGDCLAYCENLHTIDKIISFEGTTYSNSTFRYSPKLANILFEGTIAKDINFIDNPLTHDSLMSIINALKDFSGTTTTKTLTLHSDAKARLSEAEIAIATQKGWTVA